VAGDGNRDRVRTSEALSTETESNRSVLPTSWAPSPDPTPTRLGVLKKGAGKLFDLVSARMTRAR
jgi:hypothetical protein